MPAARGRSSSARCSTSSTTCTSSSRRRRWSSRSSTNVWNAVEGDLKTQSRTFADEGTTEEKAREEYRAIAERRVRLGLVLAEIGEKNNIKVTDERAQRARSWSGRASFPAGSSRSGTTTGRIPARSRACARRSTRRRWSTSCSSSPRSPTRRSTREELFKEDDDVPRRQLIAPRAVEDERLARRDALRRARLQPHIDAHRRRPTDR